jgi:hypothetical protein
MTGLDGGFASLSQRRVGERSSNRVSVSAAVDLVKTEFQVFVTDTFLQGA